MHEYTPEDIVEALRPIESLMSKSEKAQQKLKPGTWQHGMLDENLRALRIGHALMTERSGEPRGLSRENLQDALSALASMIAKTEKAQAMFDPGTSQHTLQRNRLKALRIAEALVVDELEERPLG